MGDKIQTKNIRRKKIQGIVKLDFLFFVRSTPLKKYSCLPWLSR